MSWSHKATWLNMITSFIPSLPDQFLHSLQIFHGLLVDCQLEPSCKHTETNPNHHMKSNGKLQWLVASKVGNDLGHVLSRKNLQNNIFKAFYSCSILTYLKMCRLIINYLDFPPEIPLCLLVPVSRELLQALLTAAVTGKKRPLHGRLDNVHISIAKSLSQKQKPSE